MILPLEKPIGNNEFVLGNLDFAGYYRVNYESSNWEKIIEQINQQTNVRDKKNVL